jgi:predicted enzyme related to lactoylglutathione lyase
VAVESLEECSDRILKNGGKLTHGPHDIPGISRHAYFEDAQGVMFGVLQALAMGGSD